MKLIDLLVQELPGMGGWPNGVPYLKQYTDGSLFCGNNYESLIRFVIVDDFDDGCVTQGQYEAALAAAQQPVWSGDGLPPVGCECERSWAGDKWLQCKIIFISDEIVLVKLATREAAYQLSDVKFRPIRSEAEKKRDDAIGHMEREWESVTMVPAVKFEVIYDAIAEGKIPGVQTF